MAAPLNLCGQVQEAAAVFLKIPRVGAERHLFLLSCFGNCLTDQGIGKAPVINRNLSLIPVQLHLRQFPFKRAQGHLILIRNLNTFLDLLCPLRAVRIHPVSDNLLLQQISKGFPCRKSGRNPICGTFRKIPHKTHKAQRNSARLVIVLHTAVRLRHQIAHIAGKTHHQIFSGTHNHPSDLSAGFGNGSGLIHGCQYQFVELDLLIFGHSLGIMGEKGRKPNVMLSCFDQAGRVVHHLIHVANSSKLYFVLIGS